MHQSPSVQTPALRTVGNIVTGDDIQTQIIINFSALPCLHALLSSQKKGIRKEACWTISNITAGNRDQIQAVIDANIILPLIELLRNAEFDIKKEAAWAISNATSGGTPEQIKLLVEQGCIGPLSELLAAPDHKIVNVALEGLENILKVGENDTKQTGQPNDMAQLIHEANGLEKIENLQQHETESIYEKAVKILETYLGAEEEDDQVAPQANGQQFAFGAAQQQQMGGLMGANAQFASSGPMPTKNSGMVTQQAMDSAIMSRLQELPKIAAGIMTNDEKVQLDSTTQFRKLLSIKPNPAITDLSSPKYLSPESKVNCENIFLI